MARSTAFLPLSFSLWLAMSGTAAGQAIMETGLGAARAVTTAAPAKGVGKSMSGLAGALDKALKGESRSTVEPPATASSNPPARTLPAADTAPSVPEPTWEDPAGIETGISNEELVRRFGPSSMMISDATEKTLTYRGKAGVFQVKLQNGKVSSIDKPPALRD
jgi:hypothetical protein